MGPIQKNSYSITGSSVDNTTHVQFPTSLHNTGIAFDVAVPAPADIVVNPDGSWAQKEERTSMEQFEKYMREQEAKLIFQNPLTPSECMPGVFKIPVGTLAPDPIHVCHNPFNNTWITLDEYHELRGFKHTLGVIFPTEYARMELDITVRDVMAQTAKAEKEIEQWKNGEKTKATEVIDKLADKLSKYITEFDEPHIKP
jgi:hypothetical protein